MEDKIRSKNVHVKLDRHTHASFKSSLITHGVSMQEAFEEFARCVGNGERMAVRIVERMVRERIKRELASVGLKPGVGGRRALNELDQDVIYDLINEDEQGTDETALPSDSRRLA